MRTRTIALLILALVVVAAIIGVGYAELAAIQLLSFKLHHADAQVLKIAAGVGAALISGVVIAGAAVITWKLYRMYARRHLSRPRTR